MSSKALYTLFWRINISLLQTSEYKTGFTPETFYGFSSILPSPWVSLYSVQVLTVLCLVSACGKMTLEVHFAFYGDAVVKDCVRPTRGVWEHLTIFNLDFSSVCIVMKTCSSLVLCKDESWLLKYSWPFMGTPSWKPVWARLTAWHQTKGTWQWLHNFYILQLIMCDISFCMNTLLFGDWCLRFWLKHCWKGHSVLYHLIPT